MSNPVAACDCMCCAVVTIKLQVCLLRQKEARALVDLVASVEKAIPLPWLMESALHGALRHGNAQNAWTIMDEMQRRDKALRPHYFWPLLCSTTSCPKGKSASPQTFRLLEYSGAIFPRFMVVLC